MSDVDNFRRKASRALLKVRGFLPGVKVEKTKRAASASTLEVLPSLGRKPSQASPTVNSFVSQ